MQDVLPFHGDDMPQKQLFPAWHPIRVFRFVLHPIDLAETK